MKKLFRLLANILCVLVIVALTLVVFFSLSARASGEFFLGQYGFGRVVTGSMEPVIPTGSFILVTKTDADSLVVGDIIMFDSDDPSVPQDAPVSHAIERIESNEDGTLSFITKGVANETEDPYPVAADKIFGRVIWSSSFLGRIIGFAQSAYTYPILILALLITMGFTIADVVKDAHALRQQEKNGESSSK